MVKTVAIIGAGPSGLTSIKACLEEDLVPTAFERRPVIGGVWNYDGTEWTDSREPGIYKSLITNTSKELLCFSDYPFPADWPPYLSHQQYLRYLNDCADVFDLRKYIRHEHDVTSVEQAPDYDVTGKWRVRFVKENIEDEQVFDHVMICTGMFSEAWSPSYPGQDQFGGLIIHSNQYRKPDQFVDKNVLVVGDSFSAGDVATDLGFHSKQVYLSMRKGCFVFPKRGAGGWPFDALLANRWRCLIPEWLNRIITQRFLEKDVNYDALGLRSNERLFRTDVIANDFILNQIVQGRVKTRPAVLRFFKNGVEFIDGSKLDDLDAVVFGTGYNTRIPIVDDTLVSDDFGTREIYKHILPARLKHPTIALIGIMGVFGPTSPSFEIQARWAARLFIGKLTLPPLSDMLREIEATREIMFEINHKHTIKIVPYFYNTDLAVDIGCRPNLTKLLFSDPLLAIKMMFTPAVPASFRLVGPNKWPRARDTVLKCWSNYITGTQGRVITRPSNVTKRLHFGIVSVVTFVLAVMLYAYNAD